MNKFREIHPKRTYDGKRLTNYRDYKSFLSSDFNRRCGYTDTPDYWFGGSNNFHIDHFIPPTPQTQHLETEYANLVYSCSYVNIAKSDDSGLFLDPCETDLNDHFFRNEFGEIMYFPHSEHAQYMFIKLKLYLRRYGILWTLDKIYLKMIILSDEIKATKNPKLKSELESLLAELFRHFRHYFEQFKLVL